MRRATLLTLLQTYQFHSHHLTMRFTSSNTDDESHWTDVTTGEDPVGGMAYKVIACIIFALVSYTFLFPCNLILPLDR